MKSFLFFLFSFLLAFQLQGQSSLLSEFQQKWTNAKASTLGLANAMPADHYDFKPTEEQMSFQQQLLHVVGNMAWLSNSYLGGEKLEADLKSNDYSKEEVIEILEQGFDLAMAAVKSLPASELDEEVQFFAGPMSKRQILVLMNDHLTHHRGQMIVYVRLKGVKPPAYKGW